MYFCSILGWYALSIITNYDLFKKQKSMRHYYSIIIIGLLLLSCSQAKQSELSKLSEFQVDISQGILFPLSEITEEMTVIELELTDESIINPDVIYRTFNYRKQHHCGYGRIRLT